MLIFIVSVLTLHMHIQALYEVAFASGKLMGPYLIYTVMPRKVITPDVPLCQLQLHGNILVVEESDNSDAPQPLHYLQDRCKQVQLFTYYEIFVLQEDHILQAAKFTDETSEKEA